MAQDIFNREFILGINASMAAIQNDIASIRECLHQSSLTNQILPYGDDFLVTLRQCSAAVQRSKRTLEGRKNHRCPERRLPAPEIQGVGGKASYFRWSAMKPWLEQQFNRKVPDLPKLLQENF